MGENARHDERRPYRQEDDQGNELPFDDTEGRYVGHMSIALAKRLGVSEVNTVAHEIQLWGISSAIAGGRLEVTEAELREFLTAMSENPKRGAVDWSPKFWADMTPEQKQAALVGRPDGEEGSLVVTAWQSLEAEMHPLPDEAPATPS